MKIYVCSEVSSGDPFVASIKGRFAGGPMSYVTFRDAYVPLKGKPRDVQCAIQQAADAVAYRFGYVSNMLGVGSFDQNQLVNHTTIKRPIDRLLNNIYVAGGNPIAYLAALRKTINVSWQSKDGTRQTLRNSTLERELWAKARMVERPTLVGVSAGAMIMGDSVDAFGYASVKLGTYETRPMREMVRGLGFFNAQIIPHYGSKEFPEAMVRDVLVDYFHQGVFYGAENPIILMSDKDALYVDTDARVGKVWGEPRLLTGIPKGKKTKTSLGEVIGTKRWLKMVEDGFITPALPSIYST